MHDTWAARDLPVLEATVSLQERSYMVTVTDIAAQTSLDVGVVARALEALDPVYVDFRKTTTGGDPRFWYVFRVTPAARRAVGQWPTADSLVTRLAAELTRAAKDEPDGERQSLLIYAARLMGDTLRDVAVRAAGQVLSPAFDDVDWPDEQPLPVPYFDDAAPAEAADVSQRGPSTPELRAPESSAANPDIMSVLERTVHGLKRLPDTMPEREMAAPELAPLPEPAPFPEYESRTQTGAVGADGSAGDAADADLNPAHARADSSRS